MPNKKNDRNKKAHPNDGCVFQLPSGKWRVMVSLGYQEDGTRRRSSATFQTQAEANAWKIKTLAAAQNYGTQSVKDENGMFVPRFHAWLLTEKRYEVLSPQFVVFMRYYNNYIKSYFKRYKQKELTKSIFQNFFLKLERDKVGVDSRRKIKGLLRQYFEREYENSPMRNPLDGVKYVTKKTPPKILTPADVALNENYKAVPKEIRGRFMEALDKEKYSPFLKPLCYLMYFSGNRVSETLAYQWQDFNFEQRYFYVLKSVTREYEFDDDGNRVGHGKTSLKPPKSEQGIRPLPLIDILYEAMSEWYEYRKAQERTTGLSFTAPEDYVFANNQAQLRSLSGTEKVFRNFLKRHGLDHKGIHFHALRQTFSNALFDREKDPKVVMNILGHSDVSTSLEHYHSLEKFDSVQKAARVFNDLYRPKDPKYRAGEEVTFAPEEFIPENAISIAEPNKAPERALADVLAELAAYPEMKRVLEKLKDNDDMEM